MQHLAALSGDLWRLFIVAICCGIEVSYPGPEDIRNVQEDAWRSIASIRSASRASIPTGNVPCRLAASCNGQRNSLEGLLLLMLRRRRARLFREIGNP